MDWNLLASFTGLLGGFVITIFSAGIWVSRQISSLKDFVYEKNEDLKNFILARLEYHEKHDDNRFDLVQKDLLAIKLRNAAIDGKTRQEIKDSFAP